MESSGHLQDIFHSMPNTCHKCQDAQGQRQSDASLWTVYGVCTIAMNS